MVTIETRRMSVEAFDEFVYLPELGDSLFEYIGGMIYEKEPHFYRSVLGATMGMWVGQFVHRQKIGHVTGANGTYAVCGERYMPSLGYISRERMPRFNSEPYYCPLPPELVVEVLTPGGDTRPFRIKIANYLAAGTVIWLVDPDHERIEVYAPGQPVKILGADDTLDGGAALPGFTLALRDIFPMETSEQ